MGKCCSIIYSVNGYETVLLINTPPEKLDTHIFSLLNDIPFFKIIKREKSVESSTLLDDFLERALFEAVEEMSLIHIAVERVSERCGGCAFARVTKPSCSQSRWPSY